MDQHAAVGMAIEARHVSWLAVQWRWLAVKWRWLAVKWRWLAVKWYWSTERRGRTPNNLREVERPPPVVPGVVAQELLAAERPPGGVSNLPVVGTATEAEGRATRTG